MVRTFLYLAIISWSLIFPQLGRGEEFDDNGLSGVSAYAPGEVLLRWTAPGDNGYSGRASGYDVRYQPYARGPLDTQAEWNTAVPIPGEPLPSPVGQLDSTLASGLTYGASYYFCLKAYDASGNYSPLSNSPLLTVGDTISCSYRPGDANADGHVNISDITFIIISLYKSGPKPYPLAAGDADGSGDLNIRDITYLIRNIYYDGPAPVCFGK